MVDGLERLVIWLFHREQPIHDLEIGLFKEGAALQESVYGLAFSAGEDTVDLVEVRFKDSPGDVASLVVEFADESIAASHESSLRRPAGPMSIFHVSRVGLRGEEFIASEDSDGVSAHSEEHDSDGHVALVDLFENGSVEAVDETAMLNGEGGKDGP